MSIEQFLYLADILPGISRAFGTIGGIIFVLSLIMTVVFTCILYEEGESATVSQIKIRRVFVSLLATGTFLVFIAMAIPERQTIYMIGGVKASRQFLETKLGHRVEALIDKELDKYLKEDETK